MLSGLVAAGFAAKQIIRHQNGLRFVARGVPPAFFGGSPPRAFAETISTGSTAKKTRHEHQLARHGTPPLSIDRKRRCGLSCRGVPAAAEIKDPTPRYYALAGDDCKVRAPGRI